MSRFNEYGLTPKQEAFARLVAPGLSTLSDAYRAVYMTERMTTKQIHEEASKLAGCPKVAKRIRSMQGAAADEAILVAADILTETRRLALSSVSSFFWPDGRVKLPHDLDADAAACVASFEILPDGTVKYRFWDKNAAIEKAAKHLGLYEMDNKQKTDPLQSLLDSLSGNVIGPNPDNR